MESEGWCSRYRTPLMIWSCAFPLVTTQTNANKRTAKPDKEKAFKYFLTWSQLQLWLTCSQSAGSCHACLPIYSQMTWWWKPRSLEVGQQICPAPSEQERKTSRLTGLDVDLGSLRGENVAIISNDANSDKKTKHLWTLGLHIFTTDYSIDN